MVKGWRPDWQPIDTAPKDGTHILAWAPDTGPQQAFYDPPESSEEDWAEDEQLWFAYWLGNLFRPLYWIPLMKMPDDVS